MKVAVFNTLYYPNRKGGAEKSIQLICESLAKSNIEVEVNSLWDGISKRTEYHNGVLLNKWKNRNIYSVFNYEGSKISFVKKLIWQIIDFFNVIIFIDAIKYFSKNDIDVVWSNNLSGFSLSIWLAAKIKNIKVVHTARDYYLLSNNVMLYSENNLQPMHNIISKIKCRYLKIMSSCCDDFVGISEFILSQHKDFINANRHVIYNSVDLPERSSLSIRKEKKYGYIGQVNQAKGIFRLLEHFLSNSSNSYLVVAGSRDAHLSEKYESCKRVEFVGFIEPEKFFTQVDCLIVPSLWNEPFGRVVIEALSYQCPVLLNPVGGLIELESKFKSVYNLSLDYGFNYDKENYSFDKEDLDIISNLFSSEYISLSYLNLFERKNG
ncbi:TPA: glycosyltransferase [Vibrio vulnificus]|nr:glycosyltransferase [Vibrio vulnificus]